MSFELEENTILAEFATRWTYTPIAYQNFNFNTASYGEWVRVNVLNADGRQISLGSNPYFRYKGIMTVQVFTKPGTGDIRSMQLVDFVTLHFRAKNIGGIHFLVPEVAKIGPVDGWYQVNVVCPFFREEL